MKKIIGFVGFIDCGKGTASNALIENNFTPIAFGNPLKDCVAAVFHWPRSLLEGDTKESRAWRETVDLYWSKKLNIPDFTPRKALQNIGTDLFRKKFNIDIWVSNIEKQLSEIDQDIVFTDVRMPNEIQKIREWGGKVYRIKRGNEPEWFNLAYSANTGSSLARSILENTYKVHESEWAWIGTELDGEIENNTTPEDLKAKVIRICL